MFLFLNQDANDGNLNGQDFCTESCLASKTDHLLVDTIESRVLSNKEGESSLSEAKWLEHDESLAVWVKVYINVVALTSTLFSIIMSLV